jgi:hypothetical protein
MKRTGTRAGGALLVALLLGCGGREAGWDQGVNAGSPAFGLRNGVVLVDAPVDRVVLLEPGENQALAVQPIPVGQGIVNAVPGPKGDKLFVVSAGHRAKLGDPEPSQPPRLTIIQPAANPVVQEVPLDFLTDPLSGIAVDPIDERWIVLYAGSGASQAFVNNPNELVFLDLQALDPQALDGSGTVSPVKVTLHSFGGRPVRLNFTPPLSVPGHATPQRLLIVESDQDLSILRLEDPAHSELTVPLTSGTDNRRLRPAGITVDDGEPGRDDDARIAVRLENDPTVITFQLVPETGGVGFRPTPNLTDVGGTPSDIRFVHTDGGIRLAALVPARSKATLVDPSTTLSTDVAFPAGYQNLSLVSEATGGAAGRVDVALLWNGTLAQDGVAFWELGQTAGAPYRSIETVGVTAAIAEVLDVPGKPNLRVLRSGSSGAFYVLDLGTRTAAPLLTSTSNISLSVSPLGDQVWSFSGTQVAATDLGTQHPRSLLIERLVRQVFEVQRADGGASVVILHAEGAFGATVYDAVTLDDATRRLYSGLLTGGPY